MPALKLKDKDGNWIPLPTIKGADGKSAYQQAVEAGYTGTEAAFCTALVSLKDGPFLPKSGGAMTGPVSLSGAPSEDGHAANKGYVDGKVSEAGGKRTCRFVVGTSTAGWTAKDCDYLCDGTDDQVEINAAIQALPATGGEVVILDGTYNITAAIAVNKDFTTLTGNGQSTVLKRMWNSTSSGGVIHVTSSGNTIQGLMVDGNKNTFNSRNNSGIYLHNSYNDTVTGNTCNSNSSYGIYLYNSSNNNTITGNTCNSNSYGIYLYSSSNNNTVTGNTCNSNSGYGIYLYGSSNNTITGNMCNDNSSGIVLYGSSNNDTVTGNTCNSNSSYGIFLYGSSNNTITGNTFNNNRSSGVFLSTSSNNTITGNTCIRGTGLASDYANSQHTIYFSGTGNNYNLIADNNVMGKNYTSDGGTGNTFTGNKYN